jgi:tRNA 2-selenouridine synthase SelU
MLWKKLMVNFTLLATPEVDQNEEDPNEEDSDDEDRHLNIIEQKFKKWTLSKMALQFNNWKKRLDKEFVQKEKTSVFTRAYEKIKDQWDAFMEYKTLEEAKKRSEINKKMLLKRNITILWGKEATSLVSLSGRKWRTI